MTKKRNTLADDRNPWDKQPYETEKQFVRFEHYLAIGPGRTVEELCIGLNRSGDKISIHTLRQACAQGLWTKRAEAWDSNELQITNREMQRWRTQAVKRQKTVANAIIAKAVQALQHLDVTDIGARDVVHLLKLAFDTERQIMGQPTQIVALTGPTGGPIQTEDLTQLTPEQRRQRLADISDELAKRAGTNTDDDNNRPNNVA